MKRVLIVLAFAMTVTLSAIGAALASECAGGSVSCGGNVLSCPSSGTNLWCSGQQTCDCVCVTINGVSKARNKCVPKPKNTQSTLESDEEIEFELDQLQ